MASFILNWKAEENGICILLNPENMLKYAIIFIFFKL